MTRLLPLLAIMALFLASVTVAHAQATTPTVSTVAVTSDPGTDDTYALGETIEVGLTFSEAVTVTGAPYLLIDVGGTNRRASYHSGSATTQLLFRYTVLAGDDDDDGIAVVANSLTLDGGTIVATDDATGATLDHAALTTTDHKMDSAVTLLSNFGQTELSSTFAVSGSQFYLELLTVGPEEKDYQIREVVLDIKTPSDTLNVEIRLYELAFNPTDPFYGDVNHHFATMTGSVTSAGPQTFVIDNETAGNLFDGDSYFIGVVGSGSGTVSIGLTEQHGEDSVTADGWEIPSNTGRVVDKSGYLKMTIRGHIGAIPRLVSASIIGGPYNGKTFAAGRAHRGGPAIRLRSPGPWTGPMPCPSTSGTNRTTSEWPSSYP